MKNISKFISLTFLVITGIFSNAQKLNTVTAKIEINNIEGVFNLKAVAQNQSEIFQSLNYIFLAVKKDTSKNMSSSKQENKFTLLPKETKVLSEISINMSKDDALKVYLFIKDEKTSQVIAKDSLEISSKNIKNAVAYEKTTNEENMMMTNLIINDSKTRIGDEFYRKLYSVLMLSELKFRFRVRIAELPSTGTNMMLQVFANDEIVLSFMARPEDDYLDDAVQQTVAALIAFDRDRQVNDKGFIY